MNKQEEINKVLSSKSHLMRMLTYAESMGSEEGAETYSNAVCMCDKKIARLKSQRPTEFSLAEARFLRDINRIAPRRIEQVRRRKCRTGAIVCFVIAGIAAVILLFGCNTIDGMRTDIHQWTDNPAHHQEK